MAFTLAAYTASPTVGTTEYSMPGNTTTGVPTSQTAAGYFQAMLDLSALTAEDEFIFRVYEKAVSGGTQRLVATYTFNNVQSLPNMLIVAYPLGFGWDMTLQKVAGTDRAIPFRITEVS